MVMLEFVGGRESLEELRDAIFSRRTLLTGIT
jgi:hypothetical protein